MKNKKGIIFLSGLLLLLIGLKVPTLHLPYFWDEAWPYSTAVHMMYENGLSLLPGGVPFDVSRGHPLFFHFMNASAMHIFGSSITGTHIFPLLLSILLLFTTFLFSRRFFSEQVAIFSAAILLVQPVFLAQSALLLPEIMVALLSLLTLYSFLKNNNWAYLLCGTLLLLTKESGLVAIAACGFWQLVELFVTRKDTAGLKIIFKKLLIIILPIVFGSVFFILQKVQTGFFFLPLYTNGDNFLMLTIAEKLKSFSAFLFIYQGRNVLTAALIISLVIFFFIKKKKLQSDKSKPILLLSFFILFYLIFSSANFFSPRYLLAILAPFIIIVSVLVTETFSNRKIIYYPLYLSFITVGIYFCLKKNHVNDHSLSYVDAIEVSQKMTNYCESENLYDKNIVANFLMRISLTDKYAGYLSSDKGFTKVFSVYNEQTEYLILENFEKDDLFEQVKKEKKCILIKHFEKNYAWSEIYKISAN